jgi:integrase/recombinase XerC
MTNSIQAYQEISPVTVLVSGSNVLDRLLADKRSINTKQAYLKDLNVFSEMLNMSLAFFLQLTRGEALEIALQFKAKLIEAGLSEATVNRRLSSLKALAKMGKLLEVCDWDLKEVEGETIQSYRDTSGVSTETFKQVLNGVKRETVKGTRDYALLRLLWEAGLRRGEVAKLTWADLDLAGLRLSILGKGRGTQKEEITITPSLLKALIAWREVSPASSIDSPMFVSLDRAKAGNRLTGDGLYKLIRGYFAGVNPDKVMSPHRIRHSVITELLDKSNGNVSSVQKFSRHKNLNTLMIYDDNRKNSQGEMAGLASSMLD